MKKKLYTACFLFFCITLNLFSYEKAIFSEWTKENINIDDADYFSEPITEIYTLNKEMFLIISDFQHAYLTDNKDYLKIIFANCCSVNDYGQTTSSQLQNFRLGDFYTYILDCNYDEKLDLLNYSVSGMAVQLIIKTLDTEKNLFESEMHKSYRNMDIIFCIINNKRGFNFKEPDENEIPKCSFYYWSPTEQRYILDETVTQEQIKNAYCPEDYFAYNGLKFSKLDSKLTEEDLKDLDKAQLRLMRNAVYARHGRTFKSVDLQSLWECYSWYKVNPKYSDDLLTDVDKFNIDLIQTYEGK